MNQEAAFLADILAYPEDDCPRLLLADWWEERGDPRGEFIRVQCALAVELAYPLIGQVGLDEARRRVALRRRERELLYSGKTAWLAPFKSGDWHGITNHTDEPRLTLHLRPDWTDFRVTFRRGFVESVECTAAAWLAHADALTAAAPIRQVRLTTWPDWYVQEWTEKSVTLHSGRHPNVGEVVRNCKTARAPNAYSQGFNQLHIAAMLKAEWPKIEIGFTPPTAVRERTLREAIL